MQEEPLRILGIDPGTVTTGFGVVEIRNKKPHILESGDIKTKWNATYYDRLKVMHVESQKLFDTFKPNVLAIEAPFYGKDIQATLKLGRAQGAIMLAALLHNVPIFEYAPLLVKQSITGMGRAAKEQVAYFLEKVYHLKNLDQSLDATDAIAVAICHFIQMQKPQKSKEYKGWADYVKKNPGKIK